MRQLDQVKNPRQTTLMRNGWKTYFIFTMSFAKCICRICQITIAILTKGNVERHFRTVHKKYDTDYSPKSKLTHRKVRELKSQLIRQQSFLHTVKFTSKGCHRSIVTGESQTVSMKSLQDEEMIKEAFVEAADSLFRNFKNKPEI